MRNNDLIQIKKMLTALLKNQNHIWTIGAWSWGRTEAGDPFILLYDARDSFVEKVCRVYGGSFKKLPAFINTTNIPQHLPTTNPNKDKAQKGGRYFPCPIFQIVTHDGRDTNMGRERRFGDVLWASNQLPSQPAPAPQTTVAGISHHDHWYKEAVEAVEPFMFDSALVKLENWFKDTKSVKEFRELLCGEIFTTGKATVETMLEYARIRRLHHRKDAGTAHRLAKQSALTKFEQMRVKAH
jgi:hypothetical protein